ncbi:small GTP-binding domain protein [Candidatus Magnetomorum sp. HK-1]|nr:small GTP-binding domain protein [Candidatus Magnetomorum sp. HK-1]
MEIEPQVEQIFMHMQNLNRDRNRIEKRVNELKNLKDPLDFKPDILKLYNDFPAIRSIGKLAAMKDIERNALLNIFADQPDMNRFIRWLIHSLTVDENIFKALQHVLCASFTDRNFESSVLSFLNDEDLINQLNTDLSIDLRHNEDKEFNFHKPGYVMNSSGHVLSLSLCGLELESIPQYIFLFIHLKELDLSNNQLTHIPDDIKQLNQLENINLKSNRVKEISNKFKYLKRLQKIDFSFNLLEELPDFLCQLTYLKSINLNNNELKLLPNQIGYLNQLTSLNISCNQLIELPEEIAQLAHLNKLIVNNNQLKYLPKNIAKLSQLKELYVNHNKLNSIPDDLELFHSLERVEAENNNLQMLPDSFWQLKTIRILFLKSNQIQFIDPLIKKLVHLEELDLSDNQLNNLPQEICSLTQLKRFYVANNVLVELPKQMDTMISLRDFDCSGNKLTDIPDSLWDIETIEILNLGKNKIARIPSIFSKLTRLTQFYCGQNPIISPPPEIIQNGKFAIWNYFIELEDSERLFEAKLIIVGEPESGKTCLRKKILDLDCDVRNLDGPIQPTRGIDIDIHEFSTPDIPKFKMNIWDFGGQTIYHTMHQFFLTKRSYYLFVWEARRHIEYHNFKYWLNIIQLLGENSPVTLVMNKSDLCIDELDQFNLKNKYKNIQKFFQVSCYTSDNLKELVQHIKKEMINLEHVGSDWPKRWKAIRMEIEQSSKNFMSYEDYLKRCKSYSMNDQQANYLSDYLHDLGVILHFQHDALLKHMLIINPERILHAVYRVLDDKQIIKNNGCFSYDDLQRLWKEYTSDKHPYLIQLMLKFELCFTIPDTPNYIVPQLLPHKEPDEIRLWEKKKQNILSFEYHYSFMPAGIISRLIARNHVNISMDTYWKSGFIFRYKNSEALIKENKVSDIISIQIQGPDRIILREIIKYEMKRIHISLNTPEVKEMIPCDCPVCRSAEMNEIHLFDHSILEEMKNKGKRTIPCFKSYEDMSIDALLEGQSDIPYLFICYSHKDKPQKDALLTHLKSLAESRIIQIWHDKDIETGKVWEEEISHQIAISKMAILLISPNFLASKYIRQTEIPHLCQDKQKKLIPVLIKPCKWDSIDSLKDLQIFPPDENPLWPDGASDSFIPHSELTEITSRIERMAKI